MSERKSSKVTISPSKADALKLSKSQTKSLGTSASRVSKLLLKKKETKKLEPYETITINDSTDPSYTNLVIPYRVICRQRYNKAGIIQRKQFIREIKRQELLQTKALDGVRIHREFCDPIISLPEPTELIKLTPKEQYRLEEIMRRSF